MSSSQVIPGAQRDQLSSISGSRMSADDQLTQVRAELVALDDLPTSDHAAVYARIHTAIASALSATTVQAPPGSPPGT